jgi:hypothetical protein
MLLCCTSCNLVVEIVGATRALSFECRDCGSPLEPVDHGVDPLTPAQAVTDAAPAVAA